MGPIGPTLISPGPLLTHMSLAQLVTLSSFINSSLYPFSLIGKILGPPFDQRTLFYLILKNHGIVITTFEHDPCNVPGAVASRSFYLNLAVPWAWRPDVFT